MERTRWNDDLPTYLEERFYTKDEVEKLIEELSLQCGLLFNLIPASDVVGVGETNALQTELTWGNMSGVSNADVVYELRYHGELLDLTTKQTNIDGVATYTYTGTGRGDVDVTVKYGSLLEQHSTISDCLLYDNGTESNHTDIWTPSNATLDREADYTHFYESTTGTGASASITISAGTTIDLEVYQEDGLTNTNAFAQISQNTTGRQTILLDNLSSSSASLETWYRVRLMIFSNFIRIINRDTGYYKDKPISDTFNSFRFVTAGAMTNLRFRNVKVYSAYVEQTPVSLSLTGSADIVELGDTVTVTATVLNDEDYPVTGVNVSFFEDDVLKQTVSTVNGVAEYTYTATGKGRVVIKAEVGGI